MKNGRKKSFYVFLIIFLCAVAVGIGYTVKLQSEKKKYEDLAKEAESAVADMYQAVLDAGWDGEWFLRAYDAQSEKVGSVHCDA